jgi:hypothetical protein
MNPTLAANDTGAACRSFSDQSRDIGKPPFQFRLNAILLAASAAVVVACTAVPGARQIDRVVAFGCIAALATAAVLAAAALGALDFSPAMLVCHAVRPVLDWIRNQLRRGLRSTFLAFVTFGAPGPRQGSLIDPPMGGLAGRTTAFFLDAARMRYQTENRGPFRSISLFLRTHGHSIPVPLRPSLESARPSGR